MRLWPRIVRGSVGLLVGIACALTAINLHGAYRLRQREPTRPFRTISKGNTQIAGGQRIGSPLAKVKIVVFSDYECPACRDLSERAEALLRRHGDSLAILIHHYPLNNHPNAADAAVAAECAGELDAFMRFHALLFSNQGHLKAKTWSQYAQEAGIQDTAAFEVCRRGGNAHIRVRDDIAAAESLQASATPIVIIGTYIYRGVPWDFERIVEQHLDHAER